MSVLEVVDSVNIALLACAIPVQIILIITIYRYRKQDCFKAPFFKLLVSVTVNDLLSCVGSIGFTIWLHLGAYESHPYLHPTLDMSFIKITYNSSVVGMAAIAINRIVNIVWFAKASMLWTERTTKIAIILQWSIALITAVSCLHPDTHYMYLEEFVLVKLAPNSTAEAVLTAYDIITNLSCGLTVIFCYIACLAKLLHYKMTNAQIAGNDFTREIRLFLQGLFLSCSLVIEFVTYWFFISTCDTYHCSELSVAINSVAYCASYYGTAPIAILMSSELRKHVKTLVKKQNTQVAPTT